MGITHRGEVWTRMWDICFKVIKQAGSRVQGWTKSWDICSKVLSWWESHIGERSGPECGTSASKCSASRVQGSRLDQVLGHLLQSAQLVGITHRGEVWTRMWDICFKVLSKQGPGFKAGPSPGTSAPRYSASRVQDSGSRAGSSPCTSAPRCSIIRILRSGFMAASSSGEVCSMKLTFCFSE